MFVIRGNKTKNKNMLCKSVVGQRDDLERQKTLLKNKYPNYDLIEDIGSGINLKKKDHLRWLI